VYIVRYIGVIYRPSRLANIRSTVDTCPLRKVLGAKAHALGQNPTSFSKSPNHVNFINVVTALYSAINLASCSFDVVPLHFWGLDYVAQTYGLQMANYLENKSKAPLIWYVS
jgi:hypothetical protein